MSTNPWQVDSIQEFYFLKCPECNFTHKEESDFQDHAIKNHILSIPFFERYDFAIEEIGNFEVNNEYSDSKDTLMTVKEEIVGTINDYEASEQIFLTESVIKKEEEATIIENHTGARY